MQRKLILSKVFDCILAVILQLDLKKLLL